MKCSYCDKLCKNAKSKAAHMKWCKQNPNRQVPFESINRKCEARTRINDVLNKDLKLIQKRRNTLRTSKLSGKLSWPPKLTVEQELLRRQKISKSMKGNPRAGGYRRGSGRCRGSWHDSPIAGRVWLDSSWELVYAKHLDRQEIPWKRNTKKFLYLWEGQQRFYIPDIYLPVANKYIEVKGYEVEQDHAKWKQFPHDLQIIRKDEIGRCR